MGSNTSATTQPRRRTGSRLSWLRTAAVSLLVLAGSIAFGVYVVSHWIERQVLTTDNWVAFAGPLPKQPVVSDALGRHLNDQFFDTAAVERKITDALPVRADFLAGPLAGQLHGVSENAAKKLVASDGFETIWTAANRAAMNRLVAQARGETPPLQARLNERFNINLSDSAGQLRSSLGKAAEAIPALQPAADKAVSLSADLQARPRRVHQAIRTIDLLWATLPLVITACLLGALALSHRRRRTAMAIAVSLVVVMLLELVALKWFRQEILDQVRIASNLAAVAFVYDSLTGWLRQMIIGSLLAALALYVLCLAAGPARWARSLRSLLRIDRLPDSRPAAWWHGLQHLTARWYYYILGAVAVVILACLALVVPITTRTLINALFLSLSLFALVRIIATSYPAKDTLTTDRKVGRKHGAGAVTGVTE